ncbi:transporter substrate-binding domain-containing protein [Brucella intermedia]|uniref:transporter substrate-binding domain-containing protein n=1 Tax=Brucella intermedia TaxID=94625 RepID=UPI00224A50F8|nr:transporter substrate-binding domain-containing protein [Brucella intermedia]
MKILKTLVAGAMLVAAFAGLSNGASAQENSLQRIKQAGSIKIGLEFGRPPWGYKDENLSMSGYDMEVAKLLAQDLGVKLEIIELTGPNRAPFLLSNRVDAVISTFAITSEREKVVDFSVPYSSLLAAVAAPAAMKIKDGNDLAGIRVGVTRGSTSDLYLTQQAPKADIVRFDDDATTNTSMTSNQLDVVAGEPIMLVRLAKNLPQKNLEQKFVLKETFAAVGLRKNEPQLKEWVNNWVRENLRNGRFDNLFKKFFGEGLSEAVLAGGKG